MDINIIQQIYDELAKEIYPNDPKDKPLYYKLFNELYKSKNTTLTTQKSKKVWLEPEEFYAIFEKTINSIVSNEKDKKEVYNNLKPRGYAFPPYVVTDKGFDIINSEEYEATYPIIKRALYCFYFGMDAMHLEKDKQMIKVGNELEILLRPELQTEFLNSEFRKVLEEE